MHACLAVSRASYSTLPHLPAGSAAAAAAAGRAAAANPAARAAQRRCRCAWARPSPPAGCTSRLQVGKLMAHKLGSGGKRGGGAPALHQQRSYVVSKQCCQLTRQQRGALGDGLPCDESAAERCRRRRHRAARRQHSLQAPIQFLKRGRCSGGLPARCRGCQPAARCGRPPREGRTAPDGELGAMHAIQMCASSAAADCEQGRHGAQQRVGLALLVWLQCDRYVSCINEWAPASQAL